MWHWVQATLEMPPEKSLPWQLAQELMSAVAAAAWPAGSQLAAGCASVLSGE
jgi:hypothetical protein